MFKNKTTEYNELRTLKTKWKWSQSCYWLLNLKSQMARRSTASIKKDLSANVDHWISVEEESHPGSIANRRLTVTDRKDKGELISLFHKGKRVCVCVCGHSHLWQLASTSTYLNPVVSRYAVFYCTGVSLDLFMCFLTHRYCLIKRTFKHHSQHDILGIPWLFCMWTLCSVKWM